MASILSPDLIAKLNILIYRFRFIGLYTVFGVLSLFIEFFIRSYLQTIGLNIIISTVMAVSIGIFFAFWMNVVFNFKIPPARRNKALIYFVFISSISGAIQWSLKQSLVFNYMNYETGRLIISSMFFVLGYSLHRKFSFKDYKKVGVAIYANGVEDIKNIYKKIEFYPDFIHVDMVDKTMSDNAEDIKTYKLETMKAYWPTKQVQTHIMSMKPTTWIDKVLPHSDVVYVHAECSENVDELLDKIKNSGKEPGLAVTMSTEPSKIINLLEKSTYVLLLTIPNPGASGQKFDSNGFERIKELNSLPFRNNFTLCIDGGVNESIVSMLKAENIVSGSSVLMNENPKRQIMKLQTSGRYET